MIHGVSTRTPSPTPSHSDVESDSTVSTASSMEPASPGRAPSRRPSASDGAASRRTTAPDRPLPRNACPPIGKSLVVLGLGYLATAAQTRYFTHPGTLLQDFARDPAAMMSSVMRFESRASQATLEDARRRVLERFGDYIDPDNRCFNSTAKVTSDLPLSVEGMYDFETNAVFIAPNHFCGATNSAVHEYLHCHSDPTFRKLYAAAVPDPVHARAVNEGVTHHLTRQVPIPLNQCHLTNYDVAPVGRGIDMTPVELAGKIVKALGDDGEHVLRKATLSGDPEALKQLGDALFQVLPRRVVPQAWTTLRKIAGPTFKMRPEKLAEMALGSMLLHTPQLASSALRRVVDTLPAATRTELLAQWSRLDQSDPEHPSAMLLALRQRTLEFRDEMGADHFDRLFCRPDVDENERKKAMRELTNSWKPVLPAVISRHMVDMKAA